MARIAGVNLPTQKRLEIGLTYIYGIGRSTAQKVVRELELDPDQKVRDLKGKHPTVTIKHNIGQAGFAPREWQTVMAWAEVG